MKRSLLACGLLALCALPTFAHAADGHAFIAGDVGNSTIKVEGADGDDTAFRVRGGYFFNQYVGVEAMYANYGEDSDGGVSAKLDGYGVGLVVQAPIMKDSKVSVGARFGFAHHSVDASVAGLGSASVSDDATYYGLGLGYDFTDKLRASIDWEQTSPKFDVGGQAYDVMVQTVTVGVQYRF